MQNQGITSKVTVKVPKKQGFRAQGKKITETLNMIIQVLEESRHIRDIFQIRLYGLHTKLFTFLLVYLFLFTFLSFFI